jgi:hypothetical protein
MLDTITATTAPAMSGARSLVDRDEYGPLTGAAGGLFRASVITARLLDGHDGLGHAPVGWVPDDLLL